MQGKTKVITTLGGITLLVIGACKVLSGVKPAKYSIEWIQNLTEQEWSTEREIVRQKFCDPMYDIDTRSNFERILFLFDKVKGDRAWAGKIPQGPAYHREHGYNLYKP